MDLVHQVSRRGGRIQRRDAVHRPGSGGGHDAIENVNHALQGIGLGANDCRSEGASTMGKVGSLIGLVYGKIMKPDGV